MVIHSFVQLFFHVAINVTITYHSHKALALSTNNIIQCVAINPMTSIPIKPSYKEREVM